jgi:hypothetical protein
MNDLVYLAEIASDELANMKVATFSELGIPVDVFNRLGQSGFWLVLGATNSDIDFAVHSFEPCSHHEPALANNLAIRIERQAVQHHHCAANGQALCNHRVTLRYMASSSKPWL